MVSFETLAYRSLYVSRWSPKRVRSEFTGLVRYRFTRRHAPLKRLMMKKNVWRCLATDDDDADDSIKQAKGSSQVLEGSKQVRRSLDWSRATVVENKAISVDGNIRVLVLSIEDPVDFLDGRKKQLIQDNPRWIDDYTVPGQFIAVRTIAGNEFLSMDGGDDKEADKLLPIVSSPNEARVSSALLDATILEVIVERVSDETNIENKLSHMAPGDILETSQALGRGFTSLFSTYVGLQSALEERRCLFMVCVGASGLGLMRSALSWSPVQALATAQTVTCVVVAPSVTSAAYVQEWDGWRQNGVNVVPVYQDSNEDINDVLEKALFSSPEIFSNLAKYPMECAVLISGLTGSASTFLTKRLAEHGVSRERFLFCEYF